MFVDYLLRAAASPCAKRHRNSAVVLGFAASMLAVPAQAQVMDISPNGTVSVRQGSGAATWEVVSPDPDLNSAESGPQSLPAYAYTEIGGAAQVPPQYLNVLNQAANGAGVSPALLAALVWQESRWNALATSPKGAIGLAQLMPGTARELGVDPRDPVANLSGGARYLRRLLDQFDGNIEQALAAYNAGPARVRSAGGVPAITETRKYVASIVRHMSPSFPGESR